MAGGTCLVAGYVPTSNGHGEGAVAVSADGGQTWALATVPAGIGVLQSAACLTATRLPRGGHDRDHGQRRRPGQGRAPPQRRRRAHLGAVDRRAARRGRLRHRLPVGPAVRHGGDQVVRASPPSASGAVAQSRDAGATFRARLDGLHAHHPDRGGLPDDRRLRRRRAATPWPGSRLLQPPAATTGADPARTARPVTVAPGQVTAGQASPGGARWASEKGSLVRGGTPP